MAEATADAGGGHSRYVGQVYEENYARLRHYFLIQIGNQSQADEFAHKTISSFFAWAEGRQWSDVAGYVSVHLMRIACRLCMEKLEEEGRTVVAAMTAAAAGVYSTGPWTRPPAQSRSGRGSSTHFADRMARASC